MKKKQTGKPKEDRIVKSVAIDDAYITNELSELVKSYTVARFFYDEGDFNFHRDNVNSEDVMKFLKMNFGDWRGSKFHSANGRSRASRGQVDTYKSGLVKLCVERYEIVFSSEDDEVLKPLNMKTEIEYRK